MDARYAAKSVATVRSAQAPGLRPRAFKSASHATSAATREAAGSPRKRRSALHGVVSHRLGRLGPELARNMRIGMGAQERQIDRLRRPAGGPPAATEAA